MKFEKITDNKIRIIVCSSELESKKLDSNLLKSHYIENQNFINKLLEKAKLQLGFETKGCRLLLENSYADDDYIIFTITKQGKIKNIKEKFNKNLYESDKTTYIYKFNTFDEFCEFCICISKIQNFNIKKFSKNISLYYYKNTYFLLLNNINTSYANKNIFSFIASEFSSSLSHINSFENKLIEYGKVIIKKNAISKILQYFS